MNNNHADVHNGDELPDRERRLVDVLASYLAAPEPPSRTEFLAKHPSLADELAGFLDDQDEVRYLTEPFRDTAPGIGSGAIPGDAHRPASDQETARHGTSTPGTSAGNGHIGTGAREIGDYEIISEIARGGSGVVFRGRQKSLNRPVAIKILLGRDLLTKLDRLRFLGEAEAAANLDHRNIVPIY